ncbi:MAG: hypothetical protein J7M25_11385 [Deltaproteobacteria bacterium]|nr:hypothetical protein [Deltaproteobacteria bacterium]
MTILHETERWKAGNRHHHILPLTLVTMLLAGAVPSVARASSRNTKAEARLYMYADYKISFVKRKMLDVALVPFVKTEDRFRKEGLVFHKTFAGTKLDILKWLALRFYYAHRELLYPGKPVKSKHMAVGDIIFYPTFGPVTIKNRECNEWHITDGFYRYRNLTEVFYHPLRWFGIFASDEFRVDSDQSRVNMNDLVGGFQFKPHKHLALRLFYRLENKRRNLPSWQFTHSVGLLFAAHL